MVWRPDVLVDLCLIAVGVAFIEHIVIQNDNPVRVRDLVIGPLEPNHAAILKGLLRGLGEDGCVARAGALPGISNRAIRFCLRCKKVRVTARPVKSEVLRDPVILRIVGGQFRTWVRVEGITFKNVCAVWW